MTPPDTQTPFGGHKCRTCGTDLNARFCVDCGTDSLCPKCGVLIDSPFCTSCGTKSPEIQSFGQASRSESAAELSDLGLGNPGPAPFVGVAYAQSTQSDDGLNFSTKKSNQRSKRKTTLLVTSVAVVALLALAVALNSLVGPQSEESIAIEKRGGEIVSPTLPETTTTPVPRSTTTTVSKTTTTFIGRSYCNADGIAELLGAGGFEDVPARSWEKYGLFTDDRRIKYSADGLWALAYTRYGSAPVALPRPWPTNSTPMGWLNCQSGRWVYVANAATFIPVCAAMDGDFQAAHLELLGSACL